MPLYNKKGEILRDINYCSLPNHVDYLKSRAVCKHFNQRNFGNLIILRNGDILCQDCYNKRDQIKYGDFVFLCSQCILEIVNEFIVFLKDKKQNIDEYIKGLENLQPERGNFDPDSLIAELYGKKFNKGIWEKKI